MRGYGTASCAAAGPGSSSSPSWRPLLAAGPGSPLRRRPWESSRTEPPSSHRLPRDEDHDFARSCPFFRKSTVRVAASRFAKTTLLLIRLSVDLFIKQGKAISRRNTSILRLVTFLFCRCIEIFAYSRKKNRPHETCKNTIWGQTMKFQLIACHGNEAYECGRTTVRKITERGGRDGRTVDVSPFDPVALASSYNWYFP